MAKTDDKALIQSLGWVKNHLQSNAGIMVSNRQRISYPEVSGYFLPTLYQWGERDLAVRIAKWLTRIQQKDGSFCSITGVPYSFDTGQVVRGLLAAQENEGDFKKEVLKAGDWLLSQVDKKGRLKTPSTEIWAGLADERIHLYILPVLIEAGKKFKKRNYIFEAKRVLNYYKREKNLLKFDIRLHFYLYILEALFDLGEVRLAKKGFRNLLRIQKLDGSLPAYPDVDWICSSGLAQFSLLGYKLGYDLEADRALHFLITLQTRSGGFLGSYGLGASFAKHEEISWTIKFFLDAYWLKIKREFDRLSKNFPRRVAPSDGRAKSLVFLENLNGKKVLDVGCGTGRFAKLIKQKYPRSSIYCLDISEKMLKGLPPSIKTKTSSMLNLPWGDGFFDGVYAIESLEHAIRTEKAISEMARVLKPGGKILIVDKNMKKDGIFPKSPWEKWFKSKEIQKILKKNHIHSNFEFIAYDNLKIPDEVFIAWKGVKYA